jgi:hypothetical protein
MDLSLLMMFVNSDKVAGWTRAGVASALATALVTYPGLSDYLSPAAQTALGILASSIAVGLWSHLSKAMASPKKLVNPPTAPFAPNVPRVILIPFALLLLLAPGTAKAQTVTKAPASILTPSGSCTSVYCVGPYIGGGIAESGGSFNVVSTGLSGLADNNLNLFGEVGYDYWNGGVYLGLNGLFEYGVSSNGVIPGGGNSELWGGGAWAKLGYNVAGALGISPPSGSAPSLTGLVTSSVPYINLGVWSRPWGTGFLSGVGIEGWLSKNITVHIDYNHVNYNNANVNPNVTQQTEDMVIGGVDYHFSL